MNTFIDCYSALILNFVVIINLFLNVLSLRRHYLIDRGFFLSLSVEPGVFSFHAWLITISMSVVALWKSSRSPLVLLLLLILTEVVLLP